MPCQSEKITNNIYLLIDFLFPKNLQTFANVVGQLGMQGTLFGKMVSRSHRSCATASPAGRVNVLQLGLQNIIKDPCRQKRRILIGSAFEIIFEFNINWNFVGYVERLPLDRYRHTFE